MSLFNPKNLSLGSTSNNVYVVVEDIPDLPGQQKLVCAFSSRDQANHMCLDPTQHRSVKTVPFVDGVKKDAFEPVAPKFYPIDPLNPIANPDMFPPKGDPFATRKDDFKTPFAPKKPDTRFNM